MIIICLELRLWLTNRVTKFVWSPVSCELFWVNLKTRKTLKNTPQYLSSFSLTILKRNTKKFGDVKRWQTEKTAETGQRGDVKRWQRQTERRKKARINDATKAGKQPPRQREA
jgi:hypothetical protein